MQVTTFEGIIKNGQIKIKDTLDLPENAVVYIVIPNFQERAIKMMSPHLVNKVNLNEFEREIIEVKENEL